MSLCVTGMFPGFPAAGFPAGGFPAGGFPGWLPPQQPPVQQPGRFFKMLNCILPLILNCK